ncbi:MAG: response regulator [Chloroflexi bacterium]|nr:response regulator [Chloroflexota bacterium]
MIDDEAPVRELVRLLLIGAPATLTAVETLEQALAALAKDEHDIVLTDLHLGEVLGWEVAARVRARWPRTTIALLTGATQHVDREEAAGRGIDLVLAKPFRRAQLLATIEEGMRLRSQRNG